MKWLKDHLIISLIIGLVVVVSVIVVIALVVNNKPKIKEENFAIKTVGYYVYKGSDAWYQITFKDDETFLYEPWYCPKSACGGGGNESGTYKIDGKEISINIPAHYTDGDPMIDDIELIPEKNYQITIINDKQITLNDEEYIWQKDNMFDEYEE